jgi:hypothetical protein
MSNDEGELTARVQALHEEMLETGSYKINEWDQDEFKECFLNVQATLTNMSDELVGGFSSLRECKEALLEELRDGNKDQLNRVEHTLTDLSHSIDGFRDENDTNLKAIIKALETIALLSSSSETERISSVIEEQARYTRISIQTADQRLRAMSLLLFAITLTSLIMVYHFWTHN